MKSFNRGDKLLFSDGSYFIFVKEKNGEAFLKNYGKDEKILDDVELPIEFLLKNNSDFKHIKNIRKLNKKINFEFLKDR